MPGDAFLLRTQQNDLTLKLIAEIKASARELRRAAERSRLAIAESQQALRRASSGPSPSATAWHNHHV